MGSKKSSNEGSSWINYFVKTKYVKKEENKQLKQRIKPQPSSDSDSESDVPIRKYSYKEHYDDRFNNVYC